MSAVLKVQERGQVTLPKDLRERLGICPGDMLICSEAENGAIQLSRVRRLSFDDVFGRDAENHVTDPKAVATALERGKEDAAREATRGFHE